MSLVRSKDNRTGITYVYESESYWDKEKQQPRAHRKLIGKIDEATGEIVPTDGRGRKRKSSAKPSAEDAAQREESLTDFMARLEQKDSEIARLTEENRRLHAEIEELVSGIGSILERHGKVPKK